MKGRKMSAIRSHWKATANVEKTGFAQAPLVVCADGFTMSVQASQFHHCAPRQLLKSGEYDAWEIGFPSSPEDLILSFAAEADKPTDTVYGYVPTAIVDAVIEKHGGLKCAPAS